MPEPNDAGALLEESIRSYYIAAQEPPDDPDRELSLAEFLDAAVVLNASQSAALQSIAASLIRIADQLERRYEPTPIRRQVLPLPSDLPGLETHAHLTGTKPVDYHPTQSGIGAPTASQAGSAPDDSVSPSHSTPHAAGL